MDVLVFYNQWLSALRNDFERQAIPAVRTLAPDPPLWDQRTLSLRHTDARAAAFFEQLRLAVVAITGHYTDINRLGLVGHGMLTAKLCLKPKGQQRPADVVSNTVHVMKIATGEIAERLTDDGKNAAAVALGRKGGLARAKNMSKARRAQIARRAAKRRWKR